MTLTSWYCMQISGSIHYTKSTMVGIQSQIIFVKIRQGIRHDDFIKHLVLVNSYG